MSINHINALKAFENQFFSNFPRYAEDAKEPSFVPVVNSIETESAYELDVDLPGISKESITLDVKDRELSISGERLLKDEHKKEDYFNFESRYGSFKRVFTLPEDADAENISASSEHGVLSISIPKLEELHNQYAIEIK